MPLDEAIVTLQAPFMIFSFVLGLLVGSFANVCIGRWPHGESVIQPRSRCPKCLNSIKWYDNIPVLSWLVLGAKCRHCDQPISWQYPLVEALTGVLFLLVYWRFGFTLASPVYMFLAVSMVIVTFQDLADWTIPDEITIPGIFIGLLLSLVGMFFPESALLTTQPFDALIGVVVGGGVIYLIDRLTLIIANKPGMGFGDVKLLAMLGAFFGWQGVIGIFMGACLLGSVVGVSVITFYRIRGEQPAADTDADAPHADAKKDPDDSDELITLEGHYLPFGPYLAISGIIYAFCGPQIIDAYLKSSGFSGFPTALLFP